MPKPKTLTQIHLEECQEQTRQLNHLRMQNKYSTPPYFHGIEFNKGFYHAMIYHWEETKNKKKKVHDWYSEIQFEDCNEALEFSKDYAERNGIETREE